MFNKRKHQKHQRFFFYGTLRDHSKTETDEMTPNVLIKGYKLYKVKNVRFPAIIKTSTKHSKVIGTLHDLTKMSEENFENFLQRIDFYEGVPHLYLRQETFVYTNGKRLKAYIYVFNRPERLSSPIKGKKWQRSY